MKKFLWRLAILALIVAILAVAFGKGKVLTYTVPLPGVVAASSGEQPDLPHLKTLKIVDAKEDPTKVQVSVKIGKNNAEADAIADFLTIYRWGRGHFAPIKCGKDYPPELCTVGNVTISILIEKKIPSTTQGPVMGYAVIADMGLDQVQIDVLLDQDTTQPTTFPDLVAYHKQVAQDTQDTGGFITIYKDPPIYTGLK